MSDFLNVSSSLTGRRWVGLDLEVQRAAEAMAQATALPAPPVCTVLARRGVSAEEAQSFLEPTLRDLLPDPRRLKDMEAAATRTLAALDKGERIAIFADYDVDGATSATLLIDWFRQAGQRVTLYIPPDRIDEATAPPTCPRWRNWRQATA